MLHGDVPTSFATIGQTPISSIPAFQETKLHSPHPIPSELTVPTLTTPSTEGDEGQEGRGEYPGPAQTSLLWEDLVFKAE